LGNPGKRTETAKIMDNQQYNKLVSFIWNIATDVLVHAFEKGDYKKIILPFTVLRRLDVILEGTKAQVLAKKEFCDRHGLPYEQFLPKVTGYPFYNASAFTMATLKNEIDPQRLKMNVLEYFNGFSPDVQDIIDKFQLRHWVDALTAKGRLGSVLEKFTASSINLSSKPVLDEEGNELLPALDNHTMGTMFEQLLRRFNEENNVTEAGEHFTPRDYVRLLARLAVEPVADSLADGTYTIYDGASGTGGILTVTQEVFAKVAASAGRNIRTMIFGQELQDDTYATCKADLMISGAMQKFSYRLDGVDHQYIACGSTISQDGHAGEKFDFCVMNPPFGTPWKEDLKNWGLGDKKEISDPRFFDGETSFIPDIGDCQMLFLANSLSRMKADTPLGTRIVEVHNGSSLFTGSAGGGESNLRRHIIENDMLEAVIAMPEKDFYNTGIGTYIWIVTNRKEPRRRGKVQLIDARAISTPLKKNLGEKNCETSEADADRILKLLLDFRETPESKIFDNEEFGYWDVPVLRPKRDKDGNVVRKKGQVVMARSRGESEQVPLTYPGGIEAFYEREVKPYDPEAVFGEPLVGYELSFTKYFYKPAELRPLEDIARDLAALERETAGLLREVLE
jgi:type I restriction enzyme M protein